MVRFIEKFPFEKAKKIRFPITDAFLSLEPIGRVDYFAIRTHSVPIDMDLLSIRILAFWLDPSRLI